MTFAQKQLQFDLHLGKNNPAGMFNGKFRDRTRHRLPRLSGDPEGRRPKHGDGKRPYWWSR